MFTGVGKKGTASLLNRTSLARGQALVQVEDRI